MAAGCRWAMGVHLWPPAAHQRLSALYDLGVVSHAVLAWDPIGLQPHVTKTLHGILQVNILTTNSNFYATNVVLKSEISN